MIGWDCVDCNDDTRDDYYMVHDNVWHAAGMQKSSEEDSGMIHRACLEKRLGRNLVMEDYTDFPINNWIRLGLDKFAWV